MRTPWHKAGQGVLEELRAQLAAAYPDLHAFDMGDFVQVRGSFPILFEGRELDRYFVELDLRDDPSKAPVVREVGGRIPKVVDRHVYDGDACIFVRDEWRIYRGGRTLIDFLNGPVRNYFLSQSLVELDDGWPFGERPHGLDGVLEFYADRVGRQAPEVGLRVLRYLTEKRANGQCACPCGSGKRVSKCHMPRLIDLRAKIRPEDAACTLRVVLAARSTARPEGTTGANP